MLCAPSNTLFTLAMRPPGIERDRVFPFFLFSTGNFGRHHRFPSAFFFSVQKIGKPVTLPNPRGTFVTSPPRLTSFPFLRQSQSPPSDPSPRSRNPRTNVFYINRNSNPVSLSQSFFFLFFYFHLRASPVRYFSFFLFRFVRNAEAVSLF